MKQSSEIDNGEKQQQQLFLPEILDVHNFFFLYAFRIVTCCFNMRLLPSAPNKCQDFKNILFSSTLKKDKNGQIILFLANRFKKA